LDDFPKIRVFGRAFLFLFLIFLSRGIFADVDAPSDEAANSSFAT